MPGTPSSASQLPQVLFIYDGGLGHDQIERRAALAHADLHLLVPRGSAPLLPPGGSCSPAG